MAFDKNTFCIAPWFGVHVNPEGILSPCCKYREPTRFAYNNIEQYFQSDTLKKLRQDLLNGIKNENCMSCWTDEEKYGHSLRTMSNKTFGLFSEYSISEQINRPEISKIQMFDLSLGNLCNLKCLMCDPTNSSQLLAEVNLHPELTSNFNFTKKNVLDQKKYDWPKTKNFVDWCEEYLPKAIHIAFAGGEPFIIPWIESVIENIPDKQKIKCILHFTTNLTVVNHSILKVFEKFKEVWISVSCEGIWSTLEYIRYGHKWTDLCLNLKMLKNKNIKNLKIGINHVVQAPSYHSIIPMTHFFDSLDLQINPILLSDPECYHISALSKKSKQEFLDRTNNYKGKNLNFIQFVRSATRKYLEQDRVLTDACVKRLTNFDKVRKTDYKKIIPLDNLQKNY